MDSGEIKSLSSVSAPQIKPEPLPNLQISDSFTHYRSVSYFEAISSVSSTCISKESNLGALSTSDHHLKKQNRLSSCSTSTPCTPKKIEINKYSTLPSSVICNTAAGSTKKSRSLSNFFSKLKPKFHRSAIDMKNPWIVIEFSPNTQDNDSCDGSDKSDHSFELAIKTKEEHFTSLKDLHENSTTDSCKCILSSSSSKRKDLSGSDFLSPDYNKSGDNFGSKCQGNDCSKYRSEASVFFRLSPRRKFERIKHVLRTLTRRNKCQKCSSAGCLESKRVKSKSETHLKIDHASLHRNVSSFLSQLENDSLRAHTPTVLFSSTKESLYSDVNEHLKVPISRSVNANLSAVAESSSRPASLNLTNRSPYGSLDVVRARVKMTSVESIGSCSLDFDASDMSDKYGAPCLTASEFTLQSSKGGPCVNGSNDLLRRESSEEKRFRTQLFINNTDQMNGNAKVTKTEYTVAEIKLPSYVSISCALNGYVNYSRFCRSRDNSPARSFRKSSLEANFAYDSSTSDAHSKRISDPGVRCPRSYSDCNGSARNGFSESRERRISSQLQIPSKSSYTTELVINPESNGSLHEEPLNGHNGEKFPLAKEVGISGAKSLVQQRIESLYGVPAQQKAKFRTSRPTETHIGKNSSSVKRSPSCPPQAVKSQLDTNLPVFRHLTKDFRDQLLLDDATSTRSSSKQGKSAFKLKPVSLDHDKKVKPSPAVAVNGAQTNGYHSLPAEIGTDECDRQAISIPSQNVILKKKDGIMFLDVMEMKAKEILKDIRKWEEELKKDLPEEVSGKIRSACGKANLLLSQKFQQFRGLCLKNIEEDEETPFYTTGADLAGFWDMVMLQVEDVFASFHNIQNLKDNGWQEAKSSAIPPKVRKAVSPISKSNPCTPKRTAKSTELAQAREEARKQLIAAKRRGRQQNNAATDSEVSIFVPGSS